MISFRFAKGENVALESLLRSIDYRHRLLPSLQELNAALVAVRPSSILRTERGVKISQAESPHDKLLLKTDLELGLESYRRLIDDG